MLPLREHLLSTISCVHSTVAHVQNAYEAVQPEDIAGEDEVKPDRTPSRARPVRSTIPQPSSHTIASSKPFAGEDPTPLNSDDSQGDTPRDTNSEPPIRRSLLVRKPQGFSAEGGVSASTTGGVTAVPNTGNLQKIHAPLLGESNADNPAPGDQLVKSAEDSRKGEKLSSPSEKLQLPGVKAHTSRFRRVVKNDFSQINKPLKRADDLHIIQQLGKKSNRWGRWARNGWVPTQEGAYAMALLPYWIGVIESSLRPVHWLVFTLWLCGYFAFNAGGLWLRSHRKDRYFKPLQIYGAITLVLGVISLLVAPPLLEWTLVFFPLIVVAVVESVLHRERSLLARTSTILATGVMSLVSYDIGTQFSRSFAAIPWLEHTATSNVDWVVSPTGNLQGWGWMLVVAWVITSYYWSTVPYVRSLVRRRNSQPFWFFSIGAHAVLTAVILAFFILGWVTWWHLLVWTLLLARSIAVPLLQKKYPQALTVSRIGFAEIAVAMLIIITLLV